MPLDQDTIRRAGLDPSMAAPTPSREAERSELLRRSTELSGEQAAISQDIAGQMGAREEALAPEREAMRSRLSEPTLAPPREERVPSYQRPTVSPQDMQETMGIMLAASMLVGIASRTPFYGAMEAMTGAMNGYMKGDKALVDESMATYDKNVQAIKARNESYRREYDEIMKKDATDLGRMKMNLELLAAKYDDPIAMQQARQKSIGAAQKYIDDRLRSLDTATYRMESLHEKARAVQERANRSTEQKRVQAEKNVASMTGLIDQAVNMIDADPTIVGGFGRISRGMEWAQNVSGISEGTPASDFLAVLTQLKNEYKKSPYGGAATKFKADAAQVDHVVQGLGAFTSAQQARSALMGLRNHLLGLAYKDEGVQVETPRVPPGAQTATNPKTGEKMYWDGQKWQKIQ